MSKIENLMRFICLFLLILGQINTWAQVNVHDEPLHKVVFENEFLYIMETIAKPGESALPHAHHHNYCYQAIRGGKMKLFNEASEEREVNLPSGFTGGIFDAHEKPYVHAFQNIDDHDIRFIAVEHKSNQPRSSIGFKAEENAEILLQNDFFVMIELDIHALSSFTLEFPIPAVIINSAEAKIHKQDREANQEMGLWFYQEPSKKLNLSVMANENVKLVVIMVK